jgi:hypothetical protein
MRFAGGFAERVFCVAAPKAFGVALFSDDHRTKIQRNKTANLQRRLAHFSHAAVALGSFGISLSLTQLLPLFFRLPLMSLLLLL